MNKKIYKCSWFYLLLITIILFIRLLLCLHSCLNWICIFKRDYIWTAIGSIGSLLSVVIAVISIINSEETRKKQATFDAFDKFKSSNYELEIKIDGYNINNVIDEHKDNSNDKWNEIKLYLTSIERIATCVNNGVFDYNTIYNMSGPYLIHMYEKLLPIILYKRVSENRKVYEEFEKLIFLLKNERSNVKEEE